jgi:hypothetical protein
METQTEYILYYVDPHSGSWYGLYNPASKLRLDGPEGVADIASWNPRAWQKFIWDDFWVAGLNYFYQKIGDDPVVMVLGGDAIQGNRFLANLMTAQINEQVQLAADAMEYAFGQLNIRRVYLAYGTEAHVGIDGDGECLIAKQLNKQHRPVVATPMALIPVGGGSVSIAHHGFYVGEANLRGNSARLMLQRRMVEDMLLTNQRPPCLYLSGHWHRYLHTSHIESLGGEDIESHIVVCPALCPQNGYARQRTRSQAILWTGLVLIKITDGRVVDVDRTFVRALDMRERLGYTDNDSPGVVAFHYRGTPRSRAVAIDS